MTKAYMKRTLRRVRLTGDFGNLVMAQCTANAAFLVFLGMQSMLLVLVLVVQKPCVAL